jgi:hypothetical protein
MEFIHNFLKKKREKREREREREIICNSRTLRAFLVCPWSLMASFAFSIVSN